MLYAKPEEETPEGEVADAREKATRELPVMEYPQTKTCVFPPLGWQEDREKLLKRSGTVPSQVQNRGVKYREKKGRGRDRRRKVKLDCGTAYSETMVCCFSPFRSQLA